MADQHNKHTSNPGHEPDIGAHEGEHGHYILPDSVALKTLIALAVLTVITVALSFVHLGKINFLVGMLVATVKACLVVLIFMNLKHDDKANAVIFGSAFIFLAIFFGLTAPDTMTRGDVYFRGPVPMLPVKGASKFKKAWEPTDELVAHGKELYATNCASCHGGTGHGDGPAAGALNPRPRDFTADAGWKNGRKPSGIFKTLKEGIPGTGMGSFTTLMAEDRWAISHYVASIGPNVLKDSGADLLAVGVDPSKEDASSEEAPTIPVKRAMQFLAKDAAQDGAKGNLKTGAGAGHLKDYDQRLDAKTFSPLQ
jgi:caa(3)-type oxidase subunit IV